MKVIIEYVGKMVIDFIERRGITKEEKITFKNKSSKNVHGFRVLDFELILNREFPGFRYTLADSKEVEEVKIVTEWGYGNAPAEYVSRIIVDGVEIFNMDDFVNTLYLTNYDEPTEVMFAKDKKDK